MVSVASPKSVSIPATCCVLKAPHGPTCVDKNSQVEYNFGVCCSDISNYIFPYQPTEHQTSATLRWGCRSMSILVQSNILYVGWGISSLICQFILSCFEWKQKKTKIKAIEKLCSDAALCLWGLCSGCFKSTRCWNYADTGDFDLWECCLRFTVLCSKFSNRIVGIHSRYITV